MSSLRTCPDRYTECPLKEPGEKVCLYLSSNGQARPGIRAKCLGDKDANHEAVVIRQEITRAGGAVGGGSRRL